MKNLLKKHPTEWKKIFGHCISDKGLIIRLCRELKKLIPQRIKNPLNKCKLTK
jgi:hypothetical protein